LFSSNQSRTLKTSLYASTLRLASSCGIGISRLAGPLNAPISPRLAGFSISKLASRQAGRQTREPEPSADAPITGWLMLNERLASTALDS